LELKTSWTFPEALFALEIGFICARNRGAISAQSHSIFNSNKQYIFPLRDFLVKISYVGGGGGGG
jgi:hypothetical protein